MMTDYGGNDDQKPLVDINIVAHTVLPQAMLEQDEFQGKRP